ncbi:unnamed protein product, partial [Didymodactylos carnosus]
NNSDMMAKQSQNEIDTLIAKVKPKNRDLTRRDIVQATQASPSNLLLKVSSYYFNDGSNKDLLCLEGTVSVTYKGNRYNIPIEIWLTDDHPNKPPMCYVKPTPDMRIAPSSIVESDGHIVIQYLKSWRHPSSDLAHLIIQMAEAFGQQPPVFSNVGGTSASRSSYLVQGGTPGLYGQPPPSIVNTSYSTHPSYSMPSYPSLSQPSYPYPQPYGIGGQAGQIPENIYKESYITAVMDKVKYKLMEVVHQSKAEIASLQKTEEDLVKGQQRLDMFISDAQQQGNILNQYVTQLKSKTIELKDAVQKMSSSRQQSAQHNLKDDAIIIPAPIYKQLLQAYAEDHAIQDLLYYLGDGHRRNSISLDTYLKLLFLFRFKHVRELSRRQFILRATMQRCRRIAGLQVK